VITRRGREIGEKHVVTEIYDAEDARQRDDDAERMAARRCRGKENVHKRAAAKKLGVAEGLLSSFYIGAACTAQIGAVHIPFFSFSLCFNNEICLNGLGLA
jgi:hypothetical protein